MKYKWTVQLERKYPIANPKIRQGDYVFIFVHAASIRFAIKKALSQAVRIDNLTVSERHLYDVVAVFNGHIIGYLFPTEKALEKGDNTWVVRKYHPEYIVTPNKNLQQWRKDYKYRALSSREDFKKMDRIRLQYNKDREEHLVAHKSGRLEIWGLPKTTEPDEYVMTRYGPLILKREATSKDLKSITEKAMNRYKNFIGYTEQQT